MEWIFYFLVELIFEFVVLGITGEVLDKMPSGVGSSNVSRQNKMQGPLPPPECVLGDENWAERGALACLYSRNL